ncbi:MAG: RidA family protein, partial [Variovorax sp.]|uniref:RidA family protein n=1 Tax=Variovorax sp. TaxID=1871043 RepID=UPI0040380E89
PSAIRVGLPPEAMTHEGCWVGGEAWEGSPADLRLDLLCPPEVTHARPAGTYATFSKVGNLLYSSGVVGRENGAVIAGTIDDSDAGIALGERAAVAAAIALLRAARTELGGLDRVQKIVALTGYLQTGPGFTQHVRVMNAASELLRQVFPDQPLPARTTVGVASPPGGGAVEISLVLQERSAD